MGFALHKIERPQDLPARIRVRNRKSGLCCYVTIRADLIKSIGVTDKAPRFDVLIGEGDDLGKIRIKPSKNGCFGGRKVGRSDVLTLQIGAFAGLPAREIDKQFCDAKKVEKDQIEVTLPKWDEIAAVDSDEDEEDDEEVRRPAAANGGGSQPKQQPQPSAPPTQARKGAVLDRLGVTIDLCFEHEAISHGGKTIDLTTRQAAVCAALLRAMPSNVGRPWITANALGELPAHAREASLDLICNDLAKALPGIGLKLIVNKGVGVMLAKVA